MGFKTQIASTAYPWWSEMCKKILIAIAIDTGIWFLWCYIRIILSFSDKLPSNELNIIRNIFKMFGIKKQPPAFKRMAGELAAANEDRTIYLSSLAAAIA